MTDQRSAIPTLHPQARKRRETVRPAWPLAAGLLALNVGAAFAADHYSGYADAASGTRNVSGPSDRQSFTSPVPSEVGASSGANERTLNRGAESVGSAVSDSSARAEGAVLQLGGTSRASVLSEFGSHPMFAASSSNARARFTDTFTVTCPDPAACGAGRLGKMTIGFLPGGTFDAVGKLVSNAPRTNGGWRGEAHWGADLNIQSMRTDGTAGFNFSFAGGQLINNDPTGTIIRGMNASYPYIDAAMQSLTFDFIFGAPVHINMSAITETYTSINYDSSGSVGDVLSQVGLRAGWGGVFSITDALGMTWNDFDSVAPALFATSFALMDLDGLADFTVRSELTGINYLNDLVTVATVPEPNSSLVALLGLAAIAAGVPRRRRLDRSASESRKDNQ